MKHTISIILSLIVGVVVSCNDEEHNDLLPIPGDYYPTQKNHRWEYHQTEIYDHVGNQNDILLQDTLHLQLVSRASFVDLTMTSTNNLDDSINYPFAFIRDSDNPYQIMALKSQHEYSSLPPYYSEPQLFLVDNKPVGYRWKARGMDYSVVEVNGSKIINDILYTNVIQIQEGISMHFYARGVGEIYSIEKGIYSGYTHTVEFILMSYKKL